MSNTNESQVKVERYSKCRHVHETIKLSQIALDEASFCHRDEKSGLAGLAESLAQEGQQTPLIVVEEDGRYKLIAGHRRYFALRKGIEEKLTGFNDDMQVAVTIMVRGQDQSAAEFDQDVLVRSVSDNANRVEFDEFEKLKITKLFEDRGVQAKRAMAALGVKDSQHRRWVQIVKLDWLYQAVLTSEITATNAAKAVEAAAYDCTEEEFARRLQMFHAEFARWRADAQKQLDDENESRLKKQKEPKEGKQAYLKQYASPQLVQGWIRSLKKGQPFDRVREFRYGIEVDTDKLSLDIPGLKVGEKDLNEDKLRAIIVGFKDGLAALHKLFAAVRRRQPITVEEVKALEEELSAEEGGQDADDFDDTEKPATVNVAAVISKRRGRKNESGSKGDAN